MEIISGGIFMFQRIHRIGNAFKGIFISAVIVITIIYQCYFEPSGGGKQDFNLLSAIMISIGFGLSLCMIRYNYKKTKFKY